MDTLYICDIPTEYHYAVFGQYYIDLYKNSYNTGSVDFYRVYLYDNYHNYEHIEDNIIYSVIATDIPVTNDYKYRRDFSSIASTTFIFVICAVFIINIFTSFFKRGGLFSELI